MTNEDISDQLEHEPFRPFTVHVVDGASYTIGALSFAVLLRRTLCIGIDPARIGLPRRSVYVDTRHISRIEVLESHALGDG